VSTKPHRLAACVTSEASGSTPILSKVAKVSAAIANVLTQLAAIMPQVNCVGADLATVRTQLASRGSFASIFTILANIAATLTNVAA
jgi:hypothetical protein